MKSVINDLFPPDSRARRRRSIVSESRERILTSPSGASPLDHLGKTSERVYCPYCKQQTKTRIRRSDSKTTNRVNALLWIGLGDPFALTAWDWCQDIDHFCIKCNGYLARKPYRGETQAIPEDSVWEPSLGGRPEGAGLRANPNHVSELYRGRQLAVPRGADEEAMLASSSPQNQRSQMLNAAELNRDFYEPSLASHDQASVLTEARETEPLDFAATYSPNPPELPDERLPHTLELRNLNTVRHKPVELGN